MANELISVSILSNIVMHVADWLDRTHDMCAVPRNIRNFVGLIDLIKIDEMIMNGASDNEKRTRQIYLFAVTSINGLNG